MKYELGLHQPFDSLAPLLEKGGIREGLGWNINLLILFGPLIAVAIALFQVVRIELHMTKEQFRIGGTVERKSFPLFIIFLGGITLGILLIYLVGENCGC